MKKYYFSLLSVFLVAALCVGFTSCGDDGDDDTGGNNRSQGGEATTVNGKRLVNARGGKDDISYEYNSFGQIIRTNNKTYTKTYSYNENNIMVSTSNISYSSSYNTLPNDTYSLSNGRITKVIKSSSSNSDEVENYEYNYDYDGYLKTIIFSNSYSDNIGNTKKEHAISRIINYTWNDGNLVSENNKYTERTTTSYPIYQNNKPQYTSSSTYISEKNISKEYIYTEHPNVLPEFSMGTDAILGWQGYFGKSSRNMPLKVITTTSQKDTEYSSNGYLTIPYSYSQTIITTYDYVFTDGVVTKLIATHTGKTTDVDVINYTWE